MTPRETLEKYNLKTDVNSIRERIESNKYSIISDHYSLCKEDSAVLRKGLRSADLTLLCELAEKGERESQIPTAEEICAGIKKEIGIEVSYEIGCFWISAKECDHIVDRDVYGRIGIYPYNLSPALVELIAKFYKGEPK